MEDVLLFIARIVFCVIFAMSAVGHLARVDAMTGYAESRGLPAARALVILSGAVMALGVVSLVLGIWADLGALALLCFLVPTAILMHAFWKESDPQAKQTEQIQFLKDLALAGGALAFLVIFAAFGDLIGLTITEPAFSLDVDLD